MIDWFNNPLPAPKQQERNANPCIALYGAGPAETTCKECVHLRYKPHHSNVKYWKCDKRTLTNGRKTDHRVTWQACGRYEKRLEEYHGG